MPTVLPNGNNITSEKKCILKRCEGKYATGDLIWEDVYIDNKYNVLRIEISENYLDGLITVTLSDGSSVTDKINKSPLNGKITQDIIIPYILPINIGDENTSISVAKGGYATLQKEIKILHHGIIKAVIE